MLLHRFQSQKATTILDFISLSSVKKLIGFIAVRLSQYEDEVHINLFICVQSWFILSGAN